MVIGAVLIPGAAAPKLVSRAQLSEMKPGAVLVDVARADRDDVGLLFAEHDPVVGPAPIRLETELLELLLSAALDRISDGDEFRAMIRLEAVQRAIIDGQALHHMRADLLAGATVGRFTAEVDDATLDIIVGTMMLAGRRLAAGTVTADYPARVIAQLLRMLGLSPDEASTIAARGLDAAASVTA